LINVIIILIEDKRYVLEDNMRLLLKIIFFPITILAIMVNSLGSTVNDIANATTLDYDIRKQRNYYKNGGSIEHAIRKGERGF